MGKIRVLVADDETLMRKLLAQQLALQGDFVVVGEAANGREAVERAQSTRPDVVLMDLHMPLMNGAQATERIVARFPHIKVVMLTAFDDLTSLGRASGAFACLAKSVEPSALFETLRRAHGARATSPADEPAQDHSAAAARLSARAALTEREAAVLRLAIDTELTQLQIANLLSRESHDAVTESAVKHALERVMTKLRVQPRTRAAMVKRVLESERVK